jgi:hypothetical protein
MEISIFLNDGSVFKETYDNLIRIEYFNQLFENRNYEEIKDIYLDCLTETNFRLILDFLKISNNDIIAFIMDIEQVSSYETSRMPPALVEFLKRFDINDNKDYNRMIINQLLRLKEDCNYLQFDLLGDVIEYKWADNYRIMDKNLLKEILIENANEVSYDTFTDKDEVKIKDLDIKFLTVIFDYYKIDEDVCDEVLRQKLDDKIIQKLLKKTSLNQNEFKEILIKNIEELLEDLKYIT